jgi:hypothetical protein
MRQLRRSFGSTQCPFLTDLASDAPDVPVDRPLPERGFFGRWLWPIKSNQLEHPREAAIVMRWIEMLNIARPIMKIDGVRPRSVPFQGRQVRAITAPWPTAHRSDTRQRIEMSAANNIAAASSCAGVQAIGILILLDALWFRSQPWSAMASERRKRRSSET